MSHGTEVVRDCDGALLGYVQPAGDRWVPVTVFGYRLGAAGSFDDAQDVVERRGLECLLERWWFRAAEDGRWYECTIQEANADRICVQIADHGHPRVYSALTIERPGPDSLRSTLTG